jgi:RNA polymerase sigma-70 factor (ECF subfamily)
MSVEDKNGRDDQPSHHPAAASTAAIWEAFGEPLHTFIRNRVENPNDVEDLLQETFIKIHNRLDTVRDEEKLTSWLYQVARNTIIDFYRGRRRIDPLPDEIPVPPEPLEADPQARLATGLTELINALPAKYRQALMLTEIQGMKQVDLADRLGLSVSGAKSRVQRGREMLRQELLACCHIEFDRRGLPVDYTPRPGYCPRCRSSTYADPPIPAHSE